LKFEELAQQVNYMARNPETWQMFLKGLPRNILKDVVKAGAPLTYQDLKQQTVDVVQAHQTIDNSEVKEHHLPCPQQPIQAKQSKGLTILLGK
jgi:hypothetical protein